MSRRKQAEPWPIRNVRDALPLAREILLKGLEDPDCSRFEEFKAFAEGPSDKVLNISDDDFRRVMEIAEGAFHVGIAAGLLLTPAILTTPAALELKPARRARKGGMR